MHCLCSVVVHRYCQLALWMTVCVRCDSCSCQYSSLRDSAVHEVTVQTRCGADFTICCRTTQGIMLTVRGVLPMRSGCS